MQVLGKLKHNNLDKIHTKEQETAEGTEEKYAKEKRTRCVFRKS